MNNKFTEEDKDSFIKFLNFIANKSEFKLNTSEIISYFKLLNKMQQNILPKIEANILEIIEVTESKDKK